MKNKGNIKKIGRPIKKDGKKERRIFIRLSNNEFAQLLILENETGSNRSNLFRSLVLNKSDKVFLNAKELLKTLGVISGEIGKVGNNINQLAKHANRIGKNSDVSMDTITNFNHLMTDYLLVEQELHKAFRDLYRLMSK